MDYAVALTIAKYAGAVLASLAAVWSATNVVSREVDGRKRLTGAGWIAIGFIVGGLTTSLASIYLQDQLASRGSNERAAAEARRDERIILAGQPLTNLKLEWNLPPSESLATALRRAQTAATEYQTDNSQGNVAGDQGLALDKLMVVYPFLAALVSRPPQTPQPNVIVLVSLDDGQNAAFAFGAIGHDLRWARNRALATPADSLSGCVEPYEELEAIWSGGRVQRQRAVTASVGLTARSSAISLGWKLEPETLANCVDKRNAAVGLTAALPDAIQMLLIYDVAQLPYSAGTFASRSFLDLWQPNPNPTAQATERAPILEQSTLDLTPNGRDDHRSSYSVGRLRHMRAVDADYQDDVDAKAVLIEFQRSRNESSRRP